MNMAEFATRDAHMDIDDYYRMTDFDIILLDRWSAVVRQPHITNPDRRWAYKIYQEEEPVDYGLLNLEVESGPGPHGISERNERAIITRLTNLVIGYRKYGRVVTDDTSLFGKPAFIESTNPID